MIRVSVTPRMIRWACERAGRDVEDVASRVPQVTAWIRGEKRPTLRQLEMLAQAAHTPLGYLFLDDPPDETLPIPDYRVLSSVPERPSPDLLESIYAMQRRKDWLRETLVGDGASPLPFVGSVSLTDEPDAVGREMRRKLGLSEDWAAGVSTWLDAAGELRRRVERLGVMAVINGVVGNNTRRPLSVHEFRGFALVDPYAPLIFVNGADAKSAQSFTLAHELAHVWLGREGISGFDDLDPGRSDIEEWCNAAAAELLVPAEALRIRWRDVRDDEERFESLARSFKVSPVVAARRARDLGLVRKDVFFRFYEAQAHRGVEGGAAGRRGDFYSSQNTRVGEFLAKEVIRAALEGRIGFKEAYGLTGLWAGSFHGYAKRLGFDLA